MIKDLLIDFPRKDEKEKAISEIISFFLRYPKIYLVHTDIWTPSDILGESIPSEEIIQEFEVLEVKEDEDTYCGISLLCSDDITIRLNKLTINILETEETIETALENLRKNLENYKNLVIKNYESFKIK